MTPTTVAMPLFAVGSQSHFRRHVEAKYGGVADISAQHLGALVVGLVLDCMGWNLGHHRRSNQTGAKGMPMFLPYPFWSVLLRTMVTTSPSGVSARHSTVIPTTPHRLMPPAKPRSRIARSRSPARDSGMMCMIRRRSAIDRGDLRRAGRPSLRLKSLSLPGRDLCRKESPSVPTHSRTFIRCSL
jgi:hypothetical protein